MLGPTYPNHLFCHVLPSLLNPWLTPPKKPAPSLPTSLVLLPSTCRGHRKKTTALSGWNFTAARLYASPLRAAGTGAETAIRPVQNRCGVVSGLVSLFGAQLAQ